MAATTTAPAPPLDAVTARRDELDLHGYVVVPGVLDEAELAAVRKALAPHLADGPTGRGEFEGLHTQRVYSLVVKSRAFDRLVLDPIALELTEQYLGPSFLLSAALAINIGPEETAQALHFDDAFYPIPRPRDPVSISALWTIDEFTAENGATVVCPGSHRWGTTDITNALDTVPIEAPAGSLILYLGTTVHAGGANTSERSRLGISIQYSAGWARQQENFMIALGTDGAREVPVRLQELIGYSIHSLLMGQVNGLHPRKLLDP